MEKQISYYLMDPTKNMTILVETPVPEASFPFVAEQLMALEPSAEQVGFVCGGVAATEGLAVSGGERGLATGAMPSLKMAGGEFCGNASMSAAVYYAMQGTQGFTDAGASHANVPTDGCEIGEEKTILLQVSGASEPVEVQVKRIRDESWQGRVHMPKPVSVAEETFPDGSVHTVVRFEGIAHVIMDGAGADMQQLSIEALKQDPARAEALAASWCKHLHVDAIGLMFLNEAHDGMCETREGLIGRCLEMQPLVYVPVAGTCIWESSCASGTTAAGAYLAQQTGAGNYRLQQPGGTLEIEVIPEGEYYLMGQVKVQRRQEVVLE